jgi:hypothetical protein
MTFFTQNILTDGAHRWLLKRGLQPVDPYTRKPWAGDVDNSELLPGSVIMPPEFGAAPEYVRVDDWGHWGVYLAADIEKLLDFISETTGAPHSSPGTLPSLHAPSPGPAGVPLPEGPIFHTIEGSPEAAVRRLKRQLSEEQEEEEGVDLDDPELKEADDALVELTEAHNDLQDDFDLVEKLCRRVIASNNRKFARLARRDAKIERQKETIERLERELEACRDAFATEVQAEVERRAAPGPARRRSVRGRRRPERYGWGPV